ncbi:MAG: rhodanese-like domain-containing protein [Phycisphaerae bacterium]|nr:rhodanese-like domain-containing protein [Phycisphaerae bacterium]
MTSSIKLLLSAAVILSMYGCTSRDHVRETETNAPADEVHGKDHVAVGTSNRLRSPEVSHVSDRHDVRHDISLEEIRLHVQDMSAVLIDARSPEDFAKGHVRGAINFPAGRMDEYLPEVSRNVPPEQLVIIYCSGASCESGDMVYEYLKQLGYRNMRVYKPGWQLLASAKDLQ